MDVKHPIGKLLPIPIKLIWLLQLNIGCFSVPGTRAGAGGGGGCWLVVAYY